MWLKWNEIRPSNEKCTETVFVLLVELNEIMYLTDAEENILSSHPPLKTQIFKYKMPNISETKSLKKRFLRDLFFIRLSAQNDPDFCVN